MTASEHTKLIAAPRFAPEVHAAPELDKAQCVATFTISTPAVDNDGDILVPEGCLPHMDRYRANPVVLWVHDYELTPIAMACPPDGELYWDVTKDRVRSKAWFHCKTQESAQVWAMIEEGVLRGASVGYDQIEGKIERLPWRKGKRNGMKFLEWEPREWSVCPLPVNPETLIEAIHKPWDGKALAPSLVKAMRSRLPDEPRQTFTGWVSSRLPWKRAVLLGGTQGKGMAEDQTTVAEETEKTLPPGAQALQGFTDDLTGVLERLNEALPQVENPDVLAVCEEVGTALGEQVTKLQDATKRIYPELAGADMADTTTPTETTDEKAITKADDEQEPASEEAPPAEEKPVEEDESQTYLSAMQDAGDLLDEMSQSEHIPKSYRHACSHCGGRMKGAFDYFGKSYKKSDDAPKDEDKPADEVPPQDEEKAEDEPEPDEEEVKAIKALQLRLDNMGQAFKRVTGKAL